MAVEYNAIIQRKLPPKLSDMGRFMIPFSIISLTISHTLCDLRVSIKNLMSLSMMRKLNCGKPNPIQMTLILVDNSITYPYRVLEDVLVRVDDLLFPTGFVILDMLEDFETPLILGRPFLATGKPLIDVKLGELTLSFNKEKFVFNVFEALKHQKEHPKCYQVNIIKKTSKGH